MNKLLTFIFLPGFVLCSFCCSARQKSAQSVGYRPKLAEISVESLVDYQTTSVSETGNSLTTKIDDDKLYKIKLAVPIKLKGKTKMGLQLKYYRQRFNFDDDTNLGQNELFDYLSDQTFVNTGARFIYRRKKSETENISFLAGAEMRSDDHSWNSNSALYYANATYIKNLSATKKIGFGAYAANSLGAYSFYPLFIYESALSKRITMELVLPKSATFRYRVNDRTFLSAKASFRGWRYNLSHTIPDSDRAFTLRRSDAQFTLAYEREIHDWLWMGVETGYNKNLRYVMTNPGDRSRDAINTLSSKDATYLKFSIFVVPPRKLWSKI
ncbi:MAG: DUF6268 family outer membrane beta-barrel protein [Cyclobacteriaceae bacterium]